jgi:two-component system response regulator AtoC
MKILIVDDEQEIREKILRFFKLENDIEALTAENGLSAKRMLENEVFDAVITDLNMPGMNGMELLKWIQEEGPSLPVILMSGYGDIPDAVEAMKLGAKDYIVKPFDLEEFLIRIRRIIENHELQDKIELGKREHVGFQGWIGQSPAMLKIKDLIEKIAPTPSTVLITGESGTGKEVVARMIHQLSPRAEKPFVAINMAGVPENLLESELFGYEKGAFTGADSRKIGMFELASPGTLLLDEVGEIPIHLQVKLLRVIQDLKIQRLGSTQSIPINVRILAATNKNLEKQIQQGLFREDLYYRLNIIQITLPPLRERKEDIPLLVGHVIKKFNKLKVGNPIKGIEPEAIRALQNYQFPGNVREMENIIERAIILARTDTITLKDLGIELTNPKARVIKGTLDEMQKQAIIETLRRWEGNRTRASEELGINRKTLLNKIKEYGLSDV